MILIINYAHYIPLTKRVIFGEVACAVSLTLLPIASEIFDEKRHGYYLSFSLILAMGTPIRLTEGASYTVLKSSVYALGGVLPSMYMTAIMGGNGVSGIFILILRIIFLIIIPPGSGANFSERNLILGTYLYFFFAVGMLILGIFSLIVYSFDNG